MIKLLTWVLILMLGLTIGIIYGYNLGINYDSSYDACVDKCNTMADKINASEKLDNKVFTCLNMCDVVFKEKE